MVEKSTVYKDFILIPTATIVTLATVINIAVANMQ
jgi:hypothetical protein